MRQHKLDRRSQRTRRLLMDAMVGLMRDKRYDTITVQEITDRADVGRSTFYAHFADKDDLLADGARQMLAGLEAPDGGAAGPPDGGGGPRPDLYPTLALFRHLQGQADMYQVMARGRGLTLFQAALQEELTEVFTARLAARVPPGQVPAVPPPLLAAMVTGMLVTVIRTWLEDGAGAPAEVVDRLFRTVAGPAVRAGLRAAGPEPVTGG